MLLFKNAGRLVEDVSELPNLSGAKMLFLDTETTSFDDFEYGNRPWAGHRVCGVAVTVDDAECAWYVPTRYRGPQAEGDLNIDVHAYRRWLKDTISGAQTWVNHNVVFDAHFCEADGAPFGDVKIVDTLTRAKLLDSDRGFRGGYGLDALSEDELDEVITDQEAALRRYLDSLPTRNRKKVKDYGLIPPDIIGEYACQDVLTNRKLYWKQQADYEHIVANELPQFANIWGIEEKLTPVLYDMERQGLRVDPQMLAVKELKILTEIAAKQEELKRECEMEMEPWNAADCHELLINRWGLPVLAWTNDKDPSKPANPSFDADAIVDYLSHPVVAASEKYTRALKIIQRVRDIHTLWSVYVKPFRAQCTQAADGTWRIYPTYNQLVRTGRMSAKGKVQQMSEDARHFILPEPGEAFLSADASQIEFRGIGHYTRSQRVIDAYAKDPDADFHALVAEWCGIDRSPAKNVNFATGYGGSKKRVVRMLSGNMKLVANLMDEAALVVADPERRAKAAEYFASLTRSPAGLDASDDELKKMVFDLYCQARGEEVYEKYHEMLPELKPTMQEAERMCKVRGWVFTEHGRIRRLPWDKAWRAFNSITQGDAADTQKERTVAMCPRYNPEMVRRGLRVSAQVHDENLYQGSREATLDPGNRLWLITGLEAVEVEYTVPIRFSLGWSDVDWAYAAKDKKCQVKRETYDPEYARRHGL